MDSQHRGSCLCGEIRFEIEGDFESFYLCHCEYCRKDTGSAHASNLFSSSAKISWTRGDDKVRSFTVPSTRHTKSFCPICGSAVPSLQMEGRLLVVPAGCLDTNVSVRPDAHLFVSSRAAWDSALETVPAFETFPH